MAIIQPKFLTPITRTQSTSMAIDEAWSSGLIDRRTTPTFAEYIDIYLFKNAVSTGVVNAYLFSIVSASDPHWTTATSPGPIAGFQWDPQDGYSRQYSLLFELDKLYSANSGSTFHKKFNLAEYCGGAIPPRWIIVVENKTDITLDAGGFGMGRPDNHWIDILGVQAESV